MRILVTGGGGLVGRSLLADPRAQRHEIFAPRRAELDLADAEACATWLARARPDLVIHLAARVGGIAANMAEPARFLTENLVMGLNLLSAARKAGVRRLINMGSSCMYPKDRLVPLKESDLLTGPLEPTNEAYALAKLSVWKLSQSLGRELPGAAWRTLIPPNLFGPHDSFDPESSHLPAAVIRKIATAQANGARSVEIWGDGTVRREFLYAPDLADFIWTFHDRLGDLPETINVGSGVDVTVNEYYAAAARALGYEGVFTHDLSRPMGMTRKLMDVSVQTALGWSPPTPLETAIAGTAAWWRAAEASQIAR